MTLPYIDLRVGSCIDRLREMPEKCVQTCVTSPPYFGLRNYNGGDKEIGKEKTPAEFVASLVAVFQEVRRVLKDDGTVWLNLGDSYAGAKNNSLQTSLKDFGCNSSAAMVGAVERRAASQATRSAVQGLNSKQLLGIPWRVAFALQDDGWILRQEIIWHKPGVMPESVKDRCCKNHEQIFLLAKSPKYFFDFQALREPAIYPAGTKAAKGSAKRRDVDGVNARPAEYKVYDGMRTKRSVWTVSTKPFKGAHFATFPPDLIEPCILAGSRPGDRVLDPFLGSGTTGVVATKHGRRITGIDLNPEYLAMASDRIYKPIIGDFEV